MQRRNRCALSLLLGALLLGVCAQAQAPVPPGKEKKIRELIRVTGAAEIGQQVLHQLVPALKRGFPGESDQFWNEMTAQIKASDFVDLVVPIYAKHFSEQDLDGLIAFYSTPLGRKVIAEMPATMSECVAAGQVWGAKIGQQVAAKIKQKGGKAGS